MERTKSRYFVYISVEGNASPVRVRNDKRTQLLNLLGGEPEMMIPDKNGKYIFIADAESTLPTNCPASLILGGRGRFIRGDAVLCEIGADGDYNGFEKKHAQGMCAVLNMLR